MHSAPPILAIVGPTASGKTTVSLDLARKLDGEIISADSRQIYKGLSIGTAKPSPEQLRQVKHYFIDLLEPDQEYNAGQYGTDARNLLETMVTRKRIPIVVGGSGLYVKALLDGLFDGPGKDPEIRFKLEQQLQETGLQGLFELLKQVDPVTASQMKEIKSRQVIRALEVYYSSGKSLSLYHAEQNRLFPHRFLQVALLWDRQVLYDRINRRVEFMIEQGFVKEVSALLAKGYGKNLNALNTVGYKEIIDHLDGKISLEEAVERTKRNSRRFAKRQLTWFNADQRIHWLTMSEGEDMQSIVSQVLQLFSRLTKQ
ncbi:MAG: tRNA (adenosine(37)-N6)-dimethylallyltransferase MiaA [bacterium]